MHTVLLVDDDAGIRRVLGFLLEKQGYRVVVAVDGRDAVAAAERVEPDVIVMDLVMPVMSGIEAARALRADPRTAGVPIIAYTGDLTPSYDGDGLGGIFDTWVFKASVSQLLATVRSILEGAESPALGMQGAGIG